MAEFHYYGLLKNNFGPEHGRYLIAPLREWVQSAVRHIKASDIPAIKRKSVTNFLNKLQRDKRNLYVLLPKDRQEIQYESFEPWIQWIDAQQQLRPFNAVVTEQNLADGLSYLDLLDGDDRWSIPPTILVDRNIESIVNALCPALYLAKEIIIIDAYFRFANNPLLQRLLSKMMEYRSVSSLTIVTTMDTANPENVYEREFSQRHISLPEISLITAPRGYFHDRYMLSDIGGLKAGHGFTPGVEQGVQADNLSLSLCGTEEYKKTKEYLRLLQEKQLGQIWQWATLAK